MSNALVMANIAKVKTLSRVMEPEGTAEEKEKTDMWANLCFKECPSCLVNVS